MTPLSLRAGLLLLAAMWSSPLLADAVLSLGAGDRTLDIAPSGIADMDISESGGITDVFLRLMPGRASPSQIFTGDAIGRTLVLRVCGHDPDGGRRPRAHRHGHDLPSRDDDGPGRGDAGALAWAGHM
jgi:hypothetical protein